MHEAEFGAITAPMIVAECAPDARLTAPFLLEWDDGVAGANAYREQQARYLLNHLVVRVQIEERDDIPREPVQVRATVPTDPCRRG